MLLTDGNPNTMDDLRVYESAILDVAHTEEIDLGAKMGLATEEIAEDVLDVLLDHTRSLDPQANIRRQTGVSDVVVTRQMKRWHAVHSLEVTYRDAFNNQLNDRYQAKYNEYHELSRNAREHTLRFGIGLALTPLGKAEAPVVSFVASGQQAAATYFIQVAWVSAAGQEGMASDPLSYDSPAGNAPMVSAADPPAGATGFNVYMGLTPDSTTLQNAAPVSLGQSFTLPQAGLVQGRAPGDGQNPDVYIVGGPMLRRG